MESHFPFWHPAGYYPRLLASWSTVRPSVRRLMLIGVAGGMTGGMLIPYMALFLSTRYGLGAAGAGLAFATLGGLSLPLQLAGGHLSDRWGRKRLMAVGLGVAALAFVPLVLTPTLPVALVAFFVVFCGLTLEAPVFQAAVADAVPAEERDRAYAWTYAAGNVGFAFGPLLGGLLVGLSYSLLWTALGVVLAAMAVLVLLAMPETAPVLAGEEPARPGAHIWEEPRVLVLLIILGSFWMLGGQIDVTLPLWVVRHLGYPAAFFGAMLSLNGLMIASAQIGVSALLRRWRALYVISGGALLFGLGLTLMALPAQVFLVIGMAILTTGEMLLATTVPTLLAALATPDRRGQYQGAYGLAQGAGFGVGPVLGGLIYQGLGGVLLWLACGLWGTLMAVSLLVYGRLQHLENAAAEA